MRAIEPWVLQPLRNFVDESSARLALLTTSSGQVVAQHGFHGAIDLMSVAALGAGIVASSTEIAAQMGWIPFRVVAHQGRAQAHLLSWFDTPRGRWVALVVFGSETKLGLVQVFMEQLVRDLVAATPPEAPEKREVLAADFERELNASLRALFGR
jgi:predicted regulator of Ras-like GTPase activity (Roadblock/LC7/MglB family)